MAEVENQLAWDKGFMQTVLAEEAGTVMPANAYNTSHYYRPGIPKAVQEEIGAIEDRVQGSDDPVAAEIKGSIDALRLFGRYTLKAAVTAAA